MRYEIWINFMLDSQELVAHDSCFYSGNVILYLEFSENPSFLSHECFMLYCFE